MSTNLRIGFSGKFPFSAFFDVTLSEQLFQIPTSGINARISQVPFADSARGVIAVSGLIPPYRVGVYDVNSEQQICQYLGHKSQIWGLTSLSCEGISSNPIIVSGGNGDSRILLFDAQNGSKLGQMEDAPAFTYRLLHTPEWNNSDVFVGGNSGSGFVGRYDIVRQRKIGEYSGHSTSVFGLSGIVSQNLLISAGGDETVRLWSRNEYTCQNTIDLSSSANSCCFVEETNLVCFGLSNGSVEVWDVRSLSERVGLTEIGEDVVYDIVGIDENRVVCGCLCGTVAVLEPENGRVSADAKLTAGVLGVCVLGNHS